MRYLKHGLLILVVLLASAPGNSRAQELTERVTLDIQGMACGSCEYMVESTLKGVSGVIEVKVSYLTGKAEVTYDPRQVGPDQLVATINAKTFYQARLATGESAPIRSASLFELSSALAPGAVAVAGLAALIVAAWAAVGFWRALPKPAETPTAPAERGQAQGWLPDARKKGNAMASMETLTGTAIDAKVLQAPGLAALDFYQESCPPCRALEPRLERVARQYDGRVAVYRVDIDHDLPVAQRLDVTSLPTVLVFRDGREVERLTGLITDGDLRVAFERALGQPVAKT